MQTFTTSIAPVRSDIAREMSDFMLGRPGCSRSELREQFSERQIDCYAIEAKNIADKRSVRRVA